jgi:hypothetical protein
VHGVRRATRSARRARLSSRARERADVAVDGSFWVAVTSARSDEDALTVFVDFAACAGPAIAANTSRLATTVAATALRAGDGMW